MFIFLQQIIIVYFQQTLFFFFPGKAVCVLCVGAASQAGREQPGSGGPVKGALQLPALLRRHPVDRPAASASYCRCCCCYSSLPSGAHKWLPKAAVVLHLQEPAPVDLQGPAKVSSSPTGTYTCCTFRDLYRWSSPPATIAIKERVGIVRFLQW